MDDSHKFVEEEPQQRITKGKGLGEGSIKRDNGVLQIAIKEKECSDCISTSRKARAFARSCPSPLSSSPRTKPYNDIRNNQGQCTHYV